MFCRDNITYTYSCHFFVLFTPHNYVFMLRDNNYFINITFAYTYTYSCYGIFLNNLEYFHHTGYLHLIFYLYECLTLTPVCQIFYRVTSCMNFLFTKEISLCKMPRVTSLINVCCACVR